ncbi:MAG: glycerophosphodiester phosphodiesterase [Actinomycetota bacterium]
MVERAFSHNFFPIVVAHRGASRTFAENTLEAFEGAIAAGAQAVELDIRLTADGVPVVCHDPDLRRVAGREGLIHKLALKDIQESPAPGSGSEAEVVPTLREVFRLVSGRAAVDLEIKNIPGEPAFEPGGEAILEAAIRELGESEFSGPVLISSFNRASVERSRTIAPELPTGLLTLATADPAEELPYMLEAGHEFLLPSVFALRAAGPSLVSRAHEEGLRIGTWTVDDPGEIRELFSWGVDALATNDPATAVSIRRDFR